MFVFRVFGRREEKKVVRFVRGLEPTLVSKLSCWERQVKGRIQKTKNMTNKMESERKFGKDSIFISPPRKQWDYLFFLVCGFLPNN